MPGYYPDNVVKDVNDLLAIPAADQAIGVTWGEIVEILEQQKSFPIKVELVHSSRCLPHPKNRNGTMINGHNA